MLWADWDQDVILTLNQVGPPKDLLGGFTEGSCRRWRPFEGDFIRYMEIVHNEEYG